MLRYLFYGVAGLAALIVATFVAARFNDGPLLILPGGPLQHGDWVTTPVEDWSFTRDVLEIESQLVDDTTSRTTWIIELDGQAYVPCNLSFPPFKTWHHRARENGAGIIRIGDKKYPVHFTFIDDAALLPRIDAAGTQKYSGQPSPSADTGIWFFRLDYRPLS